MQQWNNKVLFPADSDYSNRVLSAKYGPAKGSGNPQIVLEMEVVTPASKEVAGVEYNIAGLKTQNYFSVNGYNEDGEPDAERTTSNRAKIKALYEQFGLPAPEDYEVPLDTSAFKGKIVLTQMRSKINKVRKTPTLEQMKKNELGDVQKHPITGKEMITYWPEVVEIYGLAPEGMGVVGGN